MPGLIAPDPTRVLGRPGPSGIPVTWSVTIADHVEALAISPDGRRVAAAAISGPVTLLDAASGATVAVMPGHDLGTTCLAWSPDGRLLASGGQDRRIRVWSGLDGSPVAERDAGGAWATAVAWSDDGRFLAGAADRELRVWNTDGGMIAGWTNAASTISDIGWKPGSTILASSGYGGITLARPGGDKPPRVFEWTGSVLVLAWSPDGRFIATGDQDSTVHFWYAQRGKDLQMWGYETKVRELAWDAGSRYLATGGGSDIVVWDCGGKGPAGSTPRMLEGHESFVSALAYQHVGRLLVSGGHDGLVALWAPHRAKMPLSRLRLDGSVAHVAWSRTDSWLLAGTSEGEVVRLEVR